MAQVMDFLKESKTHDSEKALRNTFNSVGYAMLYTSLIITFGFSLLGFSDFVPSILFGFLTGMAMMVALLTDLTLLPALLIKFVRTG